MLGNVITGFSSLSVKSQVKLHKSGIALDLKILVLTANTWTIYLSYLKEARE
jgi:hypothetical protein